MPISSTIPLISSTLSDSANATDNVQSVSTSLAAVPKFSHTLAHLSTIAREFKAIDNSGFEIDQDHEADDAAEPAKMGTTLVKQVVALLDDENEEGLKDVLKDAFPGLDDDSVSRS